MSKRSELVSTLRQCSLALLVVGVLSGMLNVLFLTGSFYMLEVYDRVIPSRSIPTLLGLSLIAAILYGFQGVIDLLRSRILLRVGIAVDDNLAQRTYQLITYLPLRVVVTDGMMPLRDLEQIRTFLSSSGPGAFFDLPWIPLYIGICFLFHTYIGLVVTGGSLLLIILALLTEMFTRQPIKLAATLGAHRSRLTETSRRNAEVLKAMGMGTRLSVLWNEVNDRYIDAQRRSSDVAGGLGAISKVLRMLLQSGVLGLGAYLVIHQEASSGVIIASSILTSRAMAPVETAIVQWKGFVTARQSWKRLKDLLKILPNEDNTITLAPPKQQLTVENLSVVPPGASKAVVANISFSIPAGSALGIIGASGCGKSSLVRGLVGVWTLASGKVRLDGAALDQWIPEQLGQHIGYLPQDVELFSGTIAQNISRFESNPDSNSVVEAAQAAGAHNLVLSFPGGYSTQIGEGGANLSAGQRQRVGLARAIYSNPFMVVLDEPNSNLDTEGEQALSQAIVGIRRRGGLVIVVAHRPNVLSSVDFILVMAAGQMSLFGERDQVIQKLYPSAVAAPTPNPLGPSAAPASVPPVPPTMQRLISFRRVR